MHPIQLVLVCAVIAGVALMFVALSLVAIVAHDPRPRRW
jgi:hypothetical protein